MSAPVATIGIDARSMVGQPTGVGRYMTNLLREMIRLEPPVLFRLYAPGGLEAADIFPEDVDTAVLKTPMGSVLRGLDNVFTWTHIRLPLHLMRKPVDLVHCPYYTLPMICPCPAVVTIHDVTFDLHPEWYTPRARFAFNGFTMVSARKARHVLTVSECSRRDIVRLYRVRPEKVTAVPLAPDPEFSPERDPGRLAEIRQRYGAGEEYILHVGSITPRRNIDRLLAAFARVRQRAPHLKLVLAGRVEAPSPPLEPLIERMGLAGSVSVTGYAEAGDLPALYSGAAVVAYPSLYEGFGLPVLEAMACGVPVVASDTSCFPEVTAGAALLVSPTDVEALAEALWSALTDMALREHLVQRGLARAASFSWERAARQTLDVYRAVLGYAPERPAETGQ